MDTKQEEVINARVDVGLGREPHSVLVSREAYARGVLDADEPIEVRVRSSDGRAVALLPGARTRCSPATS